MLESWWDYKWEEKPHRISALQIFFCEPLCHGSFTPVSQKARQWWTKKLALATRNKIIDLALWSREERECVYTDRGLIDCYTW